MGCFCAGGSELAGSAAAGAQPDETRCRGEESGVEWSGRGREEKEEDTTLVRQTDERDRKVESAETQPWQLDRSALEPPASATSLTTAATAIMHTQASSEQ